MNRPRWTLWPVAAMLLAVAAPGLAAAPTDGNLLRLDAALDRTSDKLLAITAAVETTEDGIAQADADVAQLEADWAAGGDPKAILAGLVEAAEAVAAIQHDLRRAGNLTQRTRLRLVDLRKAARNVGSRVHWLEAGAQLGFAGDLLVEIHEQKRALRLVYERIVALRDKVSA